ncbi:MAG: twin-arginine translocation signal domain-containing protein, partial [Planctomycetota bacterium]
MSNRLNRRDFVKGATVLSVGSVLAS